jgi:FAD/FMN-containing dehydrogenase
MTAYRSWGLPGPFVHQALPPEALGELAGAGAPYVLAYGNGRSYGDACVNDGHALIPMRGRARCLGFDDATGILECEAGMLLADIVRDLLPRGWFLPVSPGTRFVTVGGAVANDVHGKNHHAAGSFGDHVIDLRLRRGDGTRVRCSPDAEAGLFRATIGGLGLTGLVESVRLQLRHVETGWMSVTTRRFRTFDEFFAVNAWAEPRFEYTVAWIDCAWGRGTDLRGVYFAGNHAARERLAAAPAAVARDPWPAPPVQRRVPFVLPFSLVNELTLRAFNGVYWLNARDGDDELESIYRFFYPLDAVEDWNRIYGRRGFYQYQCVLPPDAQAAGIAALLAAIRRSGTGSFLAVLKTLGERPAPGLLSFCRPGATLALDFPNRGPATLALFRELDAVVAQAGGAIYLAKDACMPPALFRDAYTALDRFAEHKDPRFSSTLWRRLMESE